MRYEYECTECQQEFECDHAINAVLKECPLCHRKHCLKRLISNRGGFILKGKNWEKKDGY